MNYVDESIIKEVEEQRPATLPGLLSCEEKDRLIERGLTGLYRWYLSRSQAKRNWNPDTSFDWRSMRTDLSPELNEILEGYYGVEQYVPDYTAKTIQVTRKSYGRSHFQIRWGAEEEKHADTWQNAMLFSRFRTPKWIHDYKEYLRNKEWMLPWTDIFHTLFYVVFQERATQLNYLNLAIIADGKSETPPYNNDGDPVLSRVAKTIAADEAAHYAFFQELGRLYLYYYPARSLEAIFDILEHFLMPAYDLLPDRPRMGELLYKSGIYGPRQYSRDVVQVALKNMSLAGRRAFTKGLKRSRLIPDENGNLRDTTAFDFFDYNSIEKAVKKLFNRVVSYEKEVGLYEIDPTQFVPSGMNV